jgi:hypothetical protein
MSDESGAATRSLAVSSREEAHDLTVELEVDFGVRQQTRTFTDLARNGHLTFGCDAHQWISCKLRTISHQEVSSTLPSPNRVSDRRTSIRDHLAIWL